MTAAESYAARIDAVNAQRARVRGPTPDDRWAAGARRFRADPRREPDLNLATLMSYVEQDDVLVDVGGGAGRMCLPMALRCREVINVDPSPGMKGEFEESAREAGITNARFVLADWLNAGDVRGDVCLTANVTYFVGEIVPFIEKLEAAASRRVMIAVWSVPPPAMDTGLFRLVFGEEEVKAPGHEELLPVLWQMGILPDVRVLPGGWTDSVGMPGTGLPQTREEAVAAAADRIWPEHADQARGKIEEHFDTLFAPSPGGFRPLWRPRVRELLITWESRRA
jgi:hypothetical protein